MGNNPMILVIDDDKAICDLVSEFLLDNGYTYDIASTVDEALIKLQNYYFDIALLDIKLPGKSGVEFLRTFQTFARNTEVVMMTGVNDLDVAVQSMKMGASDYIVKPFTINRLDTSISTVIRNKKNLSSVSTTTRTLENNNSADMESGALNMIDAIACGVDAHVDYFDFHSKVVGEKTIDLARRFGLPENEIENWATARNEFYSGRNSYIKLLLSKLEQNPIAQVILGLTYPVIKFSESRGEQN